MSILARLVVVVAALCGAVASAQAADVATAAPTLPTFALDPQYAAPDGPTESSPWSGLSVGSDVFFVSGSGVRGGVGGAGYAEYNHEFSNGVMLDVEADGGYSPAVFRHGPFTGFNFADTNVAVGYDMGRFHPYMFAGVTLVKPNTIAYKGFTSTADSINDLFTDSNPKAFTTVGAGFDYAVTNNVTMGLQVSVSHSPALWGPGPMFLAP